MESTRTKPETRWVGVRREGQLRGAGCGEHCKPSEKVRTGSLGTMGALGGCYAENRSLERPGCVEEGFEADKTQ